MFEKLFKKEKPKALVVEDTKAIRQLVAKHLEFQDYEVTQAKNGKEGFAMLAELEPDILVTDLMMPEVNGIELIREFRNSSPDTPIIVLTGVDRPDLLDKITTKWQNVTILKKPFKANLLIRSIKDLTAV
ncbi:MAG: response regulator transcription factor [Planctomycetota bacterium]|jgi:CheY-like chemotaxis protein